ncbi:MAG TPA: hypothetical protein VEC12_07535 [Bacteroidia bacterium]|nr:hypothetical protein [Bacteroidia bacterium]
MRLGGINLPTGVPSKSLFYIDRTTVIVLTVTQFQNIYVIPHNGYLYQVK